MKLSLFLKIKAVISIVSGLALLLLPAAFMGWFGATFDASGVIMARLVGALLTGIAVLCWLASGATVSEGRQAAVTGLLVADTLGFVVVLIGQLGGMMSGLGWILVLIWLLLALGLGYYRFMAKS